MHRLSVNVRGILVVLTLCTPLTTRPAQPLAFPKVHRVDGGAGEMFANAYIIEGRSGVVVVDGLLSRTASNALRQRVLGLDKPVLAVVVTHGHPDHYGGIAQVVNGSSTIPIVATAGVDAVIRRDDAMKGDRLAAAGFDWAKARAFPNVLASEGVEITFGDITLTPVDVGPAESHHDSLWVLHGSEGKQVFVGDLIMEGVHAYTADAHTGHWLAALGRHAALLRAATTIYPGHGEPGHAAEMLARQARYLQKFRAEVLDLAQGRASLSPEQAQELERRMVRFAGHDRVSRWVIEGGSPVARELTIDSGETQPSRTHQSVEPRRSGIERTEVRFESAGVALVGHLYRPANRTPTKGPAIVVVPPWLNVKEQVATNYARALAERGLVALAFDFRHWGESGGEPRQFESPRAKVEDLRNAVTFLESRPDVDSRQIGILGICFGAGYALQEAIDDSRVRSLATVAAWLHDAGSLEAAFGPEEISRRRKVGLESLAKYVESRAVAYVPASSMTDKEAAMVGVDYYVDSTRGPAAKQWVNRMAIMSWPGWLDFDAIAIAPKLTTPLLMVHSDGSALPDNVRRVYAAAAGPKDLHWTQGNHTEFYDKDAHVTKAADAVATHFKRTLAAN